MVPTSNQDSLGIIKNDNNTSRYLKQNNNEKSRRNSRISFKDETENNTFLYPNSKHNNDYNSHSNHVINRLRINTLSNIDITLSPPTGTTTPPPPPPLSNNNNISDMTPPIFNLSRSNSTLLSQGPPAVKVTCDRLTTPDNTDHSDGSIDDPNNTILKTGRLLCCKTSVWYTSRQQRHRKKQRQKYTSSIQQHRQKEVQRQETYLTWREFRAVLKPHCLELYLVSPLLLHRPRLAHIIYFKYHHSTSYKSMNKGSLIKTKLKSIFNKKKHQNRYPSFRQQQKQYKLQYKRRYQPKISYLQLSLASFSDYTIKLEYENKTGGTNTFLLQGQNAIASQSWYMALYHLIPYKPHLLLEGNKTTKKPIPPFIDVQIILPSSNIIEDDTKKKKNIKKNKNDNLSIRLPLDQVVDQDSYSHIQAIDLKHCLINIINHFQSQTTNFNNGNNNHLPIAMMTKQDTLNASTLALCWRYHDRIEWIPDTSSIIGPQLIEKKHVLELRTISPPVDQVLEAPLSMEGFLIQSTNENGEFKKRHKQSRMYAMTDGHYLFLIDPSKAILPNQSERQKRGWSLNWLSAVTLMDLNHNKKEQNNHNHHAHGLHERVNHLFQSVPGFFTKPDQHQHHEKLNLNDGKKDNINTTYNSLIDNELSSSLSTTITTTNESNNNNNNNNGHSKITSKSNELYRRSKQISCAFSVIDLSFIDSVQPVRTNPINIPNLTSSSSSPSASPTAIAAISYSSSSSPIYTNPIRTFSGSSSSSSAFSIEVINELNKRRKRLFELKLNDKTCIQFEATNAQVMFEWVHRLRKIIKYGHQCRLKGIVMSQAISNLWYCHIHKAILQSGILYVRKDSQTTYRKYLCVLTRGQGLILYRYNKKNTTTMMTKKRVIRLKNNATYSFGLNHAMDLKSTDGPTYMMTNDGERTRDQVHQCAFVIWQRSSSFSNHHHYIMQIKEHISLLKLGHRLGRKGTSFIFLASSVEEKEAWLWALHHEIGSTH